MSRFAELLCPPAIPLEWPTAIARVHQSAVTLALLPSVKVTITHSLTANLKYLEMSSGCGHSTYSKSGKCGHDGRPARVPSLVFSHSKTSLVVPDMVTSQLEENYVVAAQPSAVFRTCM